MENQFNEDVNNSPPSLILTESQQNDLNLLLDIDGWVPSESQAFVPLCDRSSTGKHPSINDFSGDYDFNVQVNMTNPEKKYMYSPILKKLFVNMDINVFITFSINNTEETNLLVRALPVYTDTQHFEDPVLRCSHHSSLECNKDFPYIYHVLRSTHNQSIYDTNEESGRTSVIVPLDKPQPGSNFTNIVYKFLCKNSCVAGMNRRTTQIIFTLEDINGRVLGRKLLGVRICSCPRRDKDKEEKAYNDENNPINQESSRSTKRLSEPQLALDLKRVKMEEVSSQKFQIILNDKEKALKLKKIADIIFGDNEAVIRPFE